MSKLNIPGLRAQIQRVVAAGEARKARQARLEAGLKIYSEAYQKGGHDAAEKAMEQYLAELDKK